MALLYFIYIVICIISVLAFGKYKNTQYRITAMILSFFITPFLGIPIANYGFRP